MTPFEVAAEISLNGHIPLNQADVREAARRAGMGYPDSFNDPEPIDVNAGVWLVDVSLITLHRLRTEGHLVYAGVGAQVTMEMP